MKKLCLLSVVWILCLSCAAVTPPPRLSAVSPADEDAPEAPPPPPLALTPPLPHQEPSPRPSPTPHVHEGHGR
jgi:hypothetical protein